ncbi:putative methionyl-tRNA formyltransferase, partial [Patellaria atrata CBS 101060]
STREVDPLRILFCGSDDFSIASLRAVHHEHIARPDTIASIDVVCRPGKRTGRGLKQIREVPIKHAAQELELPVHKIDTFTGWTPPKVHDENINLIIAVSFGLFVPPRILNGAKYGGLNVHPSLLPDLRGAAPIHHALLRGDRKFGISVQTLHPKRFDHGVILAQTPYPGFDVTGSENFSAAELEANLAPIGGDMLVQTLRESLFVPPLQDLGWFQGDSSGVEFTHAPKITSGDKQVDWTTWSAEKILRYLRVLGSLW